MTYIRDATSIKALSSYFEEFYLIEIENKHIELYKAQRVKMVKPRTVNIELLCLSSMFKKALEWGYIAKLPIIRKLKHEKKPPRFLSHDEMAGLMHHAGLWLRYILLVLRNTGLRSGELLALKWEAINFDNNAVLVKSTKTNYFHSIPINPELRQTLEYLKENYISPTGRVEPRRPYQIEYVFCNLAGRRVKSFKTAFSNATRKAGLTGVSPHTLRHSVASHLIMSGVDIRTIQQTLGHRNISTTQIYTHVTNEHMQEALNKLKWQVKPQLKIVNTRDKK
jgi:integrase